MRLPAVLFALLLAMALILAYFLFGVAESDVGHGFTHPEFATMQRGGDGATRAEGVLLGGAVLGALQLVFFVLLLAFGAGGRRRGGFEERVLAGGAVVFLATWLLLVLTYRSYAHAAGGAIALSFPIPTSWMLFGVGFAPGIFILLYMTRFRSWIVSEEEVEALRRELGDSAGESAGEGS